MTIPATRSLMPLAALVCALAFSQSSLAARKPSFPAPSLDMGAIVGDPMSPVNPYNSGTDPVAMPNDARIVVFEYSRDQIFRVLTAPLKLTTIELAPGEKLTTDPAMGDSVQWLIDTDGANHVFIKPVKQGLVNTLHLTTNMREYDLTLVSSPVGGLFYQSVRFHYAGSLMARMRAKQGVDANEGGAPRPAGTTRAIPDRSVCRPTSSTSITRWTARRLSGPRRFSTTASSSGCGCLSMHRSPCPSSRITATM